MVDSGLRGLSFFGLLEDVVTSLGKNVDLLDVSQLTSDSYNHIVSVLKYCENCKDLKPFQMVWNAESNCSWLFWCEYEYRLGYHSGGFTAAKG